MAEAPRPSSVGSAKRWGVVLYMCGWQQVGASFPSRAGAEAYRWELVKDRDLFAQVSFTVAEVA